MVLLIALKHANSPFLLLCFFTIDAHNESETAFSGCVSSPKIVWGKVCGEKSLEAFWVNNCGEEIELTMYIMREDGSWHKGIDYVKPGSKTSSWICNAHSTGQVKWEVESRYK